MTRVDMDYKTCEPSRTKRFACKVLLPDSSPMLLLRFSSAATNTQSDRPEYKSCHLRALFYFASPISTYQVLNVNVLTKPSIEAQKYLIDIRQYRTIRPKPRFSPQTFSNQDRSSSSLPSCSQPCKGTVSSYHDPLSLPLRLYNAGTLQNWTTSLRPPNAEGSRLARK
jgi:hypothetical protein